RRKIASFVIGAPAAVSRWPTLSKYAIFPLRATRATAPGYWPLATSAFRTWVARASRSDESPISSGLAVGRASAQTRVVKKRPMRVVMRAANLVMADLPEEAGATVGEG